MPNLNVSVSTFQGEVTARFPVDTVRIAKANDIRIANGFMFEGEFFSSLSEALEKRAKTKQNERHSKLVSFFNSYCHAAPPARGRKGGTLKSIAANSPDMLLAIDHILSDPETVINILQS